MTASCGTQTPASAGENGWASTPSMAFPWQPVATQGNGFAYLSRSRGRFNCRRLPPVATANSINAPYSLGVQDFLHRGRGGIAFEERQMGATESGFGSSGSTKFAPLAEPAGDAKARAEADLRRGGAFEDIQDSWPEDVVSVEAVTVEPCQ
jgi:hypothetical protein